MKNILIASLLFTFCIALSGCPYQTSVPISAPAIKVNEKFIGNWKSSSSEDDKYKIAAKNEFLYSVIKHSKGSSSDEKYIGYFSEVNEVLFLNLYNDNETDAAPENYYLYRIDLKGDGAFLMRELTENIDEEFSTSDELKKFIATNMGSSFFYSKDDETYTKQ